MSYTYDCSLHEIADFNCSYIDNYFYFELEPITKPNLVKKIEAVIAEDEDKILNLLSPYLNFTVIGVFLFISILFLIMFRKSSKNNEKIIYVV